MKKYLSQLLPLLDILLAPPVFAGSYLLRFIRKTGIRRFPLCRKVLMKVGVFPISDHYYEPQFDNRMPRQPFSQDRNLAGIEWNVAGQLELLTTLSYSLELSDIPLEKSDTLEFHLNNSQFGRGDAEFWYQIIRSIKPARIFEIGSGNSTLMAINAIKKNQKLDPDYTCKHLCIEPYEMPWLEQTGVTVLRQKIEEVNVKFFSELAENDILFIDSSHMIRPQGDVLFEYLELLPTLKKGVIVHIHDIFSPKNYLKSWLDDEMLFWNEQYLLEAFLSNNDSWKIIGALNYLYHNHFEKLQTAAPFLTLGMNPGSFYIQKIS